MSETIAAIATAHGIGGICIVRISGEEALSIALSLSHRSCLRPRYATLVNLFDESGEAFGEAILIYFKAPHSFTGEDVVEVQTHGGFTASSLALDAVLALGARIANPGEFSKRAFLNGKMDLSKAEAISDLINSRSQSAAKALARSLRGELADFVANLRAALVKTLAFVEVCIDYAEDDLPADVLQNSQEMLSQNIASLEKITRISRNRRGLIEGFKVAIVGKPNVGKSSILNSMLSFSRAIVSDEAGTTRDLIEESLQIGTHLIRIVDTAGIRHSGSKLESIGISYSLRAASEADVILAVFDASREWDAEDAQILKILREQKDKKIIYVLNKCDLPRKFHPSAEDLDEDLETFSAKNFAAENPISENFTAENLKQSRTCDASLNSCAQNLKAKNLKRDLSAQNSTSTDSVLTSQIALANSINLVGQNSAAKVELASPNTERATASCAAENFTKDNSKQNSANSIAPNSSAINSNSVRQNTQANSIFAPLEISANEGVDKILTALESYLNSQNFDGLMLSNERQILSCESALAALKNASERLSCGELELFAFEINRAIEAIARISRPFERDEILDEMFSNFCLGK
ncbi:tRNA uridine-5-carboxymethylaminomethyl(34) synthesis GTPase MnmE [uncultured Campylobacter sp.]|uniref:tRNA uridine-5-carboxymethylaminomethyl(34) synthesis GTPase MnmE n=1 Tax=uncultured Campylobacter sp. TaxID=218934 RepID=UPI002618DA3E|nr:tRNA uridine-5-carboxymethylaminomethyl(34) synthesis GTPase MnmE [uncultured Campylobacter sp.]